MNENLESNTVGDEEEEHLSEAFLSTTTEALPTTIANRSFVHEAARPVSTGTLVFVALFVSIMVMLTYFGLQETIHAFGASSMTTTTPSYDCPNEIPISSQNPHQEEHRADDVDIMKNTTEYLQNFRLLPFDYWTPTYKEYKAAMVPWKKQLLQYLPTTRDVSIYESASGIGLNLLMTLEILYETRQESNQPPLTVSVYGNDYVTESVQLARTILRDDYVMSQTGGARYGQICRADSTLLHDWVPAKSFDLVYTGYVTPLQDPLNLGLPQEELDEIYADLCKSSQPDNQRQAQLLQQNQEDWFALWVQEMLRLAKPGAVVGVEMISFPTCQDLDEWGGVDYDFWYQAIDRYGWPVDPDSLILRQANLPGRRYHVMMRKLTLP